MTWMRGSFCTHGSNSEVYDAGRRAYGLASRSRGGEHACDQSHVPFLSPVTVARELK